MTSVVPGRYWESMHKTSGRWKLGLALALTTALMWGLLPIALKLLLGAMDAYTITWYRFLAAAIVLGIFQARRGALGGLNGLAPRAWLLMVVAVAGLLANYVIYLLGLDYITPGAAQVVIQLAPVLLLLGGLIVYGERFSGAQWLGFIVLLTGMALFFNHRIDELFGSFGDYALGVVLIVIAAFTWASYALAQKQLLNSLPSEKIMLVIYIAGVAVFLPPSEIGSIAELDGFGLGLLVFASVNTLIAYGAFAESLDHWEASRVSAVLAITPLLTLVFMALFSMVTDAVSPEPLNLLSMIGAILVAGGSAATALGGRRQRRAEPKR